MKGMLPRRIFKSTLTSKTEVKDLLSGLFIAELLAPSNQLWIVSPWLSDITIVDNSTGTFWGLEIDWPRRPIRLQEILGRLLTLGTTIVVATRPLNHNESFIFGLREEAIFSGLESQLVIHFREVLHIKGILGDHYYLDGSMNFTRSGVEILEEGINFDINPETVAQAQLAFQENYRGSQ